MKGKLSIITLAAAALLALGTLALAATAPANNSFLYEAYDIVVTKMLGGAVGFVIGTCALAFGAFQIIQARVFPAVFAIVGGALILASQTIVTSLGAII